MAKFGWMNNYPCVSVGKVCVIIAFLLMQSCRPADTVYPDHIKWADSVADIAYNRMATAHPASALPYLDSIYRVTPGRGIGDRWRKYNAVSNYYANYDKDSVKRKLFLDSMFLLLKGHFAQYKYEYAHSWIRLASFQQDQKKYTLAFRSFYTGRQFAAQNMDNCSLSDFSNSLGGIRYRQGQYARALPYLKQAFAESQSCSSADFYFGFTLPQGILNTTALCFEKSGHPDSALNYYQEALQFINRSEKDHPQKQDFIALARGVVEGNLGGAYAELGKFNEAEKWLKADIAVNDRQGFAIEDAQTAKIKLASLYITYNSFAKAMIVLDQLGADLRSGRGKSIANDDIRVKWYRLNWLMYDKQHQVAEAYSYLKQYQAFSDSLARMSSELKSADLDQSFKEQHAQYQLDLLSNRSLLKTVLLVAVVIFLIMAIIIALVTHRNLYRSKSNVATLKKLNRQMSTAMGSLERSQEDNTRILKVVAHDLRNPIGAITSMAAMLLDEDGRSKNDLELLGLIKASAEDSLNLVDELLQVNHPDAVLDKEPVDLESLLRYCVALLSHKALAKEQQIDLLAEPVTLDLNHEKMWRVVSNLIANAIKFSPVGAVITVKLVQQEGQVVISVKDEGIGIPAELGKKIFDPFTDARRPGTMGEQSYGLGLAISRQIVDAHGGKIWFEANAGRGTTFYISFPSI